MLNFGGYTNRTKGLILGASLANSVGAYTELRTKVGLQHITPHTFTFPLAQIPMDKRDPECLWTDDTNQMICIINMLDQNRGEIDQHLFAKILRNWVENGFPEIGQTKGEGCGISTMSVVMDTNFLRDPEDVSKNHLRGGPSSNGSLVRTAIMGCRVGSKKKIIRDCVTICKVTHCELRAVIACCMITSMVYDIVHEVDMRQVLPNAFKYNYPGNPFFKEIRKHCRISKLDQLNLDDTTMGYSLKCLGVAMWAFREQTGRYEDIITEIALQGGDADTNCAIAGAILGAIKGWMSLSGGCWIEQLREKEFLMEKFDLLQTANKKASAGRLKKSLEMAEEQLINIHR
jgi:ADP-ribosylglycohydrolase